MTRCLEAVRVWMGKNRLRLNPNQMEWLLLQRPTSPSLTWWGFATLCTHVPVITKLGYCNSFYIGKPLKTTQKFWVIKNVCITTSIPRGQLQHWHMTALHWLLGDLWVQLKGPVTVKLYPLGHTVETISHPHMVLDCPIWTREHLKIPVHQEIQWEVTWQEMLSAEHLLWNWLPPETRMAPILMVFQKQVTT